MVHQDNPRLFIEHLSELRSRFLIYILTLIVITGISFYFYPQLLKVLLFPIRQQLFYTSPAGALDFMIKVSLLAGFIISLPMFLYQLLKFLEPTLSSRLNLQLVAIIISSCVLVLMGVSFAYFIGLPAALSFLANFGSDQIQSLITTNEYYNFVSRYLLGFAIFFQLPLILFLVNKFYSVSAGSFLKLQRIVIVASLIIAAILTPTPDFINQLIMATPLIILFYFSLIIIYFVNRSVDTHKST